MDKATSLHRMKVRKRWVPEVALLVGSDTVTNIKKHLINHNNTKVSYYLIKNTN